jgi:HSP90 family molecular chaperone
MSKQIETIKFQTKINQFITLIINSFYENKEIFSENLSQTYQIYVIKFDMNHLKMQRCLKNKKI